MEQRAHGSPWLPLVKERLRACACASAAACSASASACAPHQIMLKDRKGFVRVAVEEGVDGGIVPVFHFGNSRVRVIWGWGLGDPVGGACGAGGLGA